MERMDSAERFTPDAAALAARTIEEADGNEVFFVGSFDEDGKIVFLEAVARGNESSVPALEPFVESGDVVIHNHPSGVLKPSGPDMRIASGLGNRGIGFYIIDNSVRRVYCVAEPARKKRLLPLHGESLCALMLPGGKLSTIFQDYESRDSQVGMMEAVTGAFNNGRILIAEAGTGVGKSLAYLIPSLAWALSNGERVLISTATINLQQQLIEKDIPLASRLLSGELKSVLVKGRGNYLCLRRFNEALEEDSLFRESGDDLGVIRDWVGTTDTGSRSDLPFYPLQETWSKICSETDACMGLRCRWREQCFVLKARREAAGANILVVNHHLLFSDLSLRMNGAGFEGGAVLPAFSRVIFDEAHTIERSATSFFSRTFRSTTLQKQLGRLIRHQGKKRFGILLKLQRHCDKPALFDPLPGMISTLRTSLAELEGITLSVSAGRSSLRILSLEEGDRNLLLSSMEKHRSDLSSLLTALAAALEGVDLDEEDNDFFEAQTILRRLSEMVSIMAAFREYREREESVFWFEIRGEGESRTISFIQSPLEIGPMMEQAVYDPFPTVVFTSATLTVQNSFSYWCNRVGLFQDREGVESAIFPSPFRYSRQVLLALPTDPPDPASEMFQDYVSDFVREAVLISGGSALVLFTSYGMLGRTWEAVAPALSREGIHPLRQGSEDRARLLSRFAGDVSSVLFATDSFWEGVDVPGESLRMVILCRLPFRVPTEPVLQARMEAIAAKGGNPFFQLSLPDAAMRLKQGFGRLMRKAEDRGVVAILDPRILRKSYGRILLSSLPETGISSKETERVYGDLENFLFPG